MRDYSRVGADMATMVLPLPRERAIDWDDAARAVRDVRLEVLWDTGDLYPWDDWLGDVGNLPSAESAFVAIQAAKDLLHLHASELRGAIEHGWPEELIVLDTPTHRVWVTGGPSWGEPPGDLLEPAILVAEAGITDAAGFDGYTRYDGPPIGRRRFDFDRDALRLVHFGVVAAQLAEQAAGMAHAGAEASAREWFASWLAELDTRSAHADGERELWRFAARGLATAAWLKSADGRVNGERITEEARSLATLADEDALQGRPRRRSPAAAIRECRRLANDLPNLFEALDDAVLRSDDDIRAFVAFAGGTLAEATAFEVTAHSLYAAVAAIADLRGADVADLLDIPSVPIESSPRRRRRRASHRSISICR
jgi:hypothetical protein